TSIRATGGSSGTESARASGKTLIREPDALQDQERQIVAVLAQAPNQRLAVEVGIDDPGGVGPPRHQFPCIPLQFFTDEGDPIRGKAHMESDQGIERGHARRWWHDLAFLSRGGRFVLPGSSYQNSAPPGEAKGWQARPLPTPKQTG